MLYALFPSKESRYLISSHSDLPELSLFANRYYEHTGYQWVIRKGGPDDEIVESREAYESRTN